MTKPKGVLPPAEDKKPKKPRLKKCDGSNAAESEKAFLGQEVHGIVDGSFDAGYLLTVKVGDSPLVLRGLVFEPGLSIPLSKVNDVAPTIKATTRDQQVVFPTSPVMEGSSPLARATTRMLLPSQDPADTSNEGTHSTVDLQPHVAEGGQFVPTYHGSTKQEQVNEGQVSSVRVPSVELGSTEPDYASVKVNPVTSEKEITGQRDETMTAGQVVMMGVDNSGTIGQQMSSLPEALVAKEAERIHLRQADQKDTIMEEGNPALGRP